MEKRLRGVENDSAQPAAVRHEQGAAYAGARPEDCGVCVLSRILTRRARSAARTTRWSWLLAHMQAACQMNPGKLPSEAFGESILGIGAPGTIRRTVGGADLADAVHGASERGGCAELPRFSVPGIGPFLAVYHDVAAAAADGPPLFALCRRGRPPFYPARFLGEYRAPEG